LDRADLTLANLFRVKAKNASFRQAMFDATKIRKADFSGADMYGAYFRALHWDETRLCGANLWGATIAETHNFSSAIVDRSVILSLIPEDWMEIL
jgi:uncharacterized protein YjbI with pentapeptide repeats